MLQGVDLSYNRLEGRISAMIGELKSLRYLLVRSNALYSDIPAIVSQTLGIDKARSER